MYFVRRLFFSDLSYDLTIIYFIQKNYIIISIHV